MKKIITLTAISIAAVAANADTAIPFYLVGEDMTNLTPKMQARKEALEIRMAYPDAWQTYAAGEVEEFSYFGFKLYDVECGRITLKEFLKELQEYINKNGK